MKALIIISVTLIGLVFLAMLPFSFMFLWNFVISYFHHPELKVNYWVALAILLLLGIIKGGTKIKK